MDDTTVLVLADPSEPQLAMLEKLPPETKITIGKTLDAFRSAAPEADVIFNWSMNGGLLREVFRLAPHVRWVHTRSAGLERVLFPELVASPVPLTNGSGVFSEPLGEFALAAILFFAKDLRRMVRNQEAGVWEPFDIAEISGQTVGIVGYGDIGRAVAQRVKPLDMRVLGLKRSGPPLYHVDPLVSRIYGPADLPEFLPQCDYVIVAAPLTPETRGMIDAAAFCAMKRDAVVINLGRGPVIDEPALIEALCSGRIKGAALDVFDHEPLPAGHPFYTLKNVLLSPHAADHTADWLERAMEFFVAQFARFHKGEPLLNVVEKTLGY
jgi:phosphoglycerate dehydrogenase-like enzyme